MSSTELADCLARHAKWLRGDVDGCRADLSFGELYRADLRGADLRCADLYRADLRCAELVGARLRGADLRCADLRGADLRGADLRWTGLCDAEIDEPVCRMDFGGWSICIRAEATSIGCQTHPNAEWMMWTPSDVAHMDARAEQWWQAHGEAVKAAIRCVVEKAEQRKKHE